MSISIGTDGRVVTGQTNVVIPPENAGIGDLIYRASGGAVKVIGRGTASTTSIIFDSTTYTLWGVIYGFVAGMAMVVAPEELADANFGVVPADAPKWDTAIMRNGKQAANRWAQMNTARNASYITSGSAQPDDGLLTRAYRATSLNATTFDTAANAATKQKFGSWTEYIRQTLRVNGAPGTVFGAVAPGVKVHEFGRWMGRTYFSDSTTYTNTTAGGYCYAYGNGNGEWWLPSMFELAVMMIDEHLNFVNENQSSYFARLYPAYNYWSCVPCSNAGIWAYRRTGMSYLTAIANNLGSARPVTLMKLI